MTRSAPAGLTVGVLAAAGSVAWGRTRRRHRAAAAAAATVEVVFALAAELRAGRPPAAALAVAAGAGGPLAGPLGESAAAVGAGAVASAELRRLAEIPGCGAFAAVAAAWEVTEQVGGPVADVLDRVGHALDDDDQHARSVAALLAGPRATMMMLAVLPLAGIALAQSLGAQPLRLLLHQPVGWGLLAAATGLDLLGLAGATWLTRTALRG